MVLSQFCSLSGGFIPKFMQNESKTPWQRNEFLGLSDSPYPVLYNNEKKMYETRLPRIFCALLYMQITRKYIAEWIFEPFGNILWNAGWQVVQYFLAARPCNVITVVKGTCEWSNLIIPHSATVPSGWKRERQLQGFFYPETARGI